MTTIVWTPLPSVPLMVAQEDQSNLTATINATVDPASPPGTGGTPPSVAGLAWSTNVDLPPQISVTTNANTLTVTAQSFSGLFALEIDYLVTPFGQIETVPTWQDVPNDATDVVAMKPDVINVKEIVLTVTAMDESSSPLGTVDFVIRVFANYSVARDALMGFIHAGG